MSRTPVTPEGLESAQLRLIIRRLKSSLNNAERELSKHTKDKNLRAKAMITSGLLNANDSLDMLDKDSKFKL